MKYLSGVADFRNGSKGEILAASHAFRFTPESGLNSDIARCLERARRRLIHYRTISTTEEIPPLT
jgi:hypothetical protein